MDTCECCGKRQGKWYVWDGNAEMTLCRPCVREMRAAGEDVEPIRQ